MTPRQDDLFAAVDALLEQAKYLPEPAERERLRTAAGLSRADVGRALGVSGSTIAGWETGRTEPQKERKAAYARLLEGLAARFPVPAATQVSAPDEAANEAVAQASSEPVAPAPRPDTAPVQAPATSSTSASSRSSSTKTALGQRAGQRRAAAKTAAAAGGRFSSGPLAVLDGDGTAYGVGGLVFDCAAATLPELVAWALDAGLGQERLHRHGREADPLVVLTAAATERLGLPATIEDRKGLRLPEDHPVIGELAGADWHLTRRGFGPWPRIYRPVTDGRRRCVQLAVLPWGALDVRDWGKDWAAAAAADEVPAAEIARVLGAYASRVLTPRGGGATCGIALMEALRPPTRAVSDGAGGWTSAPMPTSLGTMPIDPAPPEAPDEHPVAWEIWGRDRPADQILDEEAYEWVRDVELLTDAEGKLRFAVGIDVNTAFLAAANRLTVGLGAPQRVKQPVFDAKTPGCWRVDLSHIELDPRLPNPFTPTGERPEGLGWYATPTLEYAVELGHQVDPSEAWIRPEAAPYLDPWYTRLRDAYLQTMADLGVTKELTETEFLTAMTQHKDTDPGLAATLSAIKGTVKGGVGKLRERAQGKGKIRGGERWAALERPTWRPDIRAAVIAKSRVNMHRKMLRMAQAGLYPLGVLNDCVIYPSPGPSPLDLLPRDPATGKPLPGFRLGVSPGMVKHEGTHTLVWAAGLMDAGRNPAHHIKDYPQGPQDD